jgi:glycosyltransferase involved in cell wall biosynthesis
VKRYPRYSETFIVNEILAHEADGLAVEIFALDFPYESHFQNLIAQVRAPVNYVSADGIRSGKFWTALEDATAAIPGLWQALEQSRGEDADDVYRALLLARLARQKGVRHLHAHFATSATTVARLAARFAGIPYSFTAHAKDIFHEYVKPDDLGRKLRDAAAVITVSDFNVRYLRDRYGEDAAHVRRVYNGLDLRQFPYTEPRLRLPRVVAVGRLIEKKGFADLIDACSVLARRGCVFDCQIIGSGEQESELRERIARLGLDARVELLGPRPQSEVIRYVQESAVLTAPCVVGSDGNRDGLPTVLVEAMALGTPCVATDVTGIPELVRDGVTGLIVPQRGPEVLAAAIERLLADAALRVRLASAARRLIEEEFDVERTAAQVRRAFMADRRTVIHAEEASG